MSSRKSYLGRSKLLCGFHHSLVLIHCIVCAIEYVNKLPILLGIVFGKSSCDADWNCYVLDVDDLVCACLIEFYTQRIVSFEIAVLENDQKLVSADSENGTFLEYF